MARFPRHPSTAFYPLKRGGFRPYLSGKLKVNPLGKNPTDVWQFPKVTSGKNRAAKERTSHPAQFPIAVIERIIKASSNPNEIILDPFLGSGTTAVVALG